MYWCKVCVGALLVGAPPAPANDFYVSPTGTTSTAAGTGSLSTPWSLQTALSQPSVVHAGDTIWLRGGRYAGPFVSRLQGGPGNPVTLRQRPGERATLDGNGTPNTTLEILGGWAVYWGFEVTNSDPSRPNVQGTRPTGIDVSSPNTLFVNLVVHDAGLGFGFWEPAVNAEIYGSLIYYNGNSTFDHGIYAQNSTGTKKIEDNLIFNNRGYGLHIYGSDLAHLNNFYLAGNASFRNGLLGGGIPNRNMLLGGGVLADSPTLVSNLFYSKKDGTQPGTGWMLGYNYGLGSRNATLQNNYVADDMVFVSPVGLTMNGNTFYTTPGYFVGVSPASYPNNTYTNARPSGPVVFVRPNRYEAGRAHIVVYNWSQQATVNADVSSVLTPGTSYEIRNAQDFFGAPVKTGTYDGTAISIPMAGLSAAAPVGFAVPQSSGPEFNAFVLLPGGPVATHFFPVSPCRVLDTRTKAGVFGGPALPGLARRIVSVTTSACGIPAGTRAISANVTVIPQGSGDLAAFPGNLEPTSATAISFRSHRTRANNTLIAIAADGTLGFQNDSVAPTDLVLDVNGYFR